MRKEKIDTEVLKNSGAPEALSFETMKIMVAQFKTLQKQIKALSKDEKKSLGIGKKEARAIPESLKNMIADIFAIIKEKQEDLSIEFSRTITTDKPEGQKWLTFTNKDLGITFCINRKK